MARPGRPHAQAEAAPWWQGAVFYRVDPARFQASGDRSTGDLAGLTRRLDYLQALGVDALILQADAPAKEQAGTPNQDARPTPDPNRDADALETLIRAASAHHLRVLLRPAAAELAQPQAMLQTAHDWLSLGAAGLDLTAQGLPKGTGRAPVAAAGGSTSVALARLLGATPGARVLLCDPQTAALIRAASPEARHEGPLRGRGRRDGLDRTSSAALLVTVALLPTRAATAPALHAALSGAEGAGTALGEPLLAFSAPPRTADADAVGLAAALLLSRPAALLPFGAEIGLDTQPGAPDQPAVAAVMQWTPANVQQAAEPEDTQPSLPAPGQPTPFGPYRPFVRPPPGALTGAVPRGPVVSLDRDLPAAAPPPPPLNSLPGFTRGRLPTPSVEGERINVAGEERDPGSVLSAYRDLLALRHGNPAVRAGKQLLLPEDGSGALLFVRTTPAGTRTTGDVLVAINPGDRPLVVSVTGELKSLGLPAGATRTLFSYGPQVLTGESLGALRLPPHAVWVGELRHPGR